MKHYCPVCGFPGLTEPPRAKNVAADLGYANPFHFSRVFKSVFGISPDAFRNLR